MLHIGGTGGSTGTTHGPGMSDGKTERRVVGRGYLF